MFITFEGLDFSGKTTQANLLVERLKQRGNDVVFLREPGGTKISEKIREILLDKQHLEMNERAELFLFSAARTQLVSEVILPALQRGRIVLCDRYDDSTTAYQGFGRGLNLDQIKTINAMATAGTTPDLTVLVDIDIDEITRRQKAAGISSDRMESSGHQFYEQVRAGYLTIASSEPKRFVVINGMRPMEEIHNEIWNVVQQRL
jgi:dTMP kinase